MYIKIWNKTLRKYLTLLEENNTNIQQTLLYNFIQNGSIIIEREFGETIWNDIMKEEKSFINICNEIIDLKSEQIKNYTWKLINNIWTKEILENKTFPNKTPRSDGSNQLKSKQAQRHLRAAKKQVATNPPGGARARVP